MSKVIASDWAILQGAIIPGTMISLFGLNRVSWKRSIIWI